MKDNSQESSLITEKLKEIETLKIKENDVRKQFVPLEKEAEYLRVRIQEIFAEVRAINHRKRTK